MDTPNRNRPQVRITPDALKRLKELVRLLEHKGYAVSQTSVVSDAILSIPVPNVPAMESKSQ